MTILDDDWRKRIAVIVASHFRLVQRLKRNVQQLDDLRKILF